MNWIPLTSEDRIDEIIERSKDPRTKGVLIFKHSPRCGISAMAMSTFEENWEPEDGIPTYYLDVVKYKDLSQKVAEAFSIQHASPQVLVIKDGKCIHRSSHHAISADRIRHQLLPA